MDSRREDFEHLIQSPGWARFLAHVEREWGHRERGGGIRFEQATEKAANLTDDVTAINQVRQITVARREIHNLIAWVYAEHKKSTQDERELVPVGPPEFSRRGGL